MHLKCTPFIELDLQITGACLHHLPCGKDFINDFILNLLCSKVTCFNGEMCLIQKKAALSVFRMLGGHFWMVVFLFPYASVINTCTYTRPTSLLPPQTISFPVSGNCLCVKLIIEREGHSITHTAQAGSYQLLWADHKALMDADLKT